MTVVASIGGDTVEPVASKGTVLSRGSRSPALTGTGGNAGWEPRTWRRSPPPPPAMPDSGMPLPVWSSGCGGYALDVDDGPGTFPSKNPNVGPFIPLIPSTLPPALAGFALALPMEGIVEEGGGNDASEATEAIMS